MGLLNQFQLSELYPGSNKLRLRLLVFLILGLSPILLLSGIQATVDAQNLKKDRRNEMLVLADQAFRTVEDEISQINALMPLFEERILAGNCDDVYARLQASQPLLTNVIYLDAESQVKCSVSPAPFPAIAEMIPMDMVTGDVHQIHGQPFESNPESPGEFPLIQRLSDASDNYLGAAIFTINLSQLAEKASNQTLSSSALFAIADRSGRAYGYSGEGMLNIESIIQSGSAQNNTLMTLRGQNNTWFDVATYGIAQGQLRALIAQPSPGMWARFTAAPVRSFGVPFLTFSLALLIVWLAVDRLVLRWLPSLASRAAAYGRGEYDQAPERGIEHAPLEITALEQTLSDMASSIAERDASLTEAISLRDDALREVHHRVRNNLQIVASLIRLETHEIEDQEAKNALNTTRQRIDALGLVHETLYKETRVKSVPTAPLLTRLMEHMENGLLANHDGITITSKIADIDVSPDNAIPLALLIVEIVSKAVASVPLDNQSEIAVILDAARSDVTLRIHHTYGAEELQSSDAENALSSRLVKSFTRQLRGTLEVESEAGISQTHTVIMPRQYRDMKEPVF